MIDKPSRATMNSRSSLPAAEAIAASSGLTPREEQASAISPFNSEAMPVPDPPPSR